MAKIQSLSEAQIAKFPEYVKKWTDIGLSIEPANRSEAERGINLAYKIAGLEEPRIIWCGSPLGNGLVRCILNKDDSVWASVRDSVRDSVGDSVGDSVWDSVGDSVGVSVWDSVRTSVRDSVRTSVRDSVWASVRDSVWASVIDSVTDSVRASVWDSVIDSVTDSVRASVWASVGASVWDSVTDSVGDSVRTSVWASVWDSVRTSVWASVGASVWDSVRDSVGDSVGDSVRTSCYGQHDASWLGFYDFFHKELGLINQTKKLEGLWLIAKNAGWFIPHKNICIVSERPNVLNHDDRGRLHSEVGAALSYPDGFSIYSWHGTRVPEQWIINRESLTPQIALTWENIEQRRAACEIIGWNNILKQLNAKTIDKDTDPQIGELLEVELPDIGIERFLRVQCGTGREFAIPVTLYEYNTARECNAATYGWNPSLPIEDFIPAIRT